MEIKRMPIGRFMAQLEAALIELAAIMARGDV